MTKKGEYEKAMALCEESLALSHEMGDKRGIAITLGSMGIVALEQGKHERANQLYKASLQIRREIGDVVGAATSLYNLGDLSLKLSQFGKAQKFYEESLLLYLEIGNKKCSVENIFRLAQIQEAKEFYKKLVILLGYIDTVQEFIKDILSTLPRNFYGNRLLKLKEKIGEETFLEYFEVGKEMTIEQAAELALRKDADE